MNKITSLTAIKEFRPSVLSIAAHQKLQSVLSLFTTNKAQTHLEYNYAFAPVAYSSILKKMGKIGALADEMDHHPEWTL